MSSAKLHSSAKGSLPFDLIGMQQSSGQEPLVFVSMRGKLPAEAVGVPLRLCINSKHSALEEYMAAAGFFAALNAISGKALAIELRNFAATTPVRVIDTEGIHSLELGGMRCRVWVKAGKTHWLTPRPDGARVVLVGKASSAITHGGTHRAFRKSFETVLRRCPRLLVVLLFALAAQVSAEFGVLLLALAIIGVSSSGKSIAQFVASMLMDGEDRLQHFDGTAQGIVEFIRAQGARAVYFEDAHGAEACEALISAIMSTGNGASSRKRSRYAGPVLADRPICGTLIWSAEAGLADTVRAGRAALRSGQFARVLEMHLGAHGMFDDLCGFDSAADLAMFVQERAKCCAGAVGDAFVAACAQRWDRIHEIWPKNRGQVRGHILRAAEIDEPTGVTHRLTEALTFIGFIGAFAATHGVLPVERKHVYEALGLVLREQSIRLQGARTPVAREVIEAVRHYLQTNPARFLPLSCAADPTPSNGLAGYIKPVKGKPAYLFFPGTFNAQFTAKFGNEGFAHLRAAGYLLTQPNRENRFQVRVQTAGQGDKGKRMDFVAISASILAAED